MDPGERLAVGVLKIAPGVGPTSLPEGAVLLLRKKG